MWHSGAVLCLRSWVVCANASAQVFVYTWLCQRSTLSPLSPFLGFVGLQTPNCTAELQASADHAFACVHVSLCLTASSNAQH